MALTAPDQSFTRSCGAVLFYTQFHTAKDEYEVVDPEFNKYKELLEGQIKQVEQVQRSLVAFVQNVVGAFLALLRCYSSRERC